MQKTAIELANPTRIFPDKTALISYQALTHEDNEMKDVQSGTFADYIRIYKLFSPRVLGLRRVHFEFQKCFKLQIQQLLDARCF